MIRTLSVIALLSGCFGAGPLPTSPTDATIVFFVSQATTQNCGSAPYIGDVAIGENWGYALTYRWNPPNNCDGGGGQFETYDVPVYRFRKTGGMTTLVENAGKTQQQPNARLAVSGTLATWAYDPGVSGTTEMKIGGEAGVELSRFVGSLSYSGIGGVYTPAGTTADASAVYVIGLNNGNQGTSVNDPSYPCCSNTGGGGGSMESRAWKLAKNVPTGELLPFTPMTIYQGTLKNALVSNTDTLFYLQRAAEATSDPVTIQAVLKTGLQSRELGKLERVLGIPVGLSANDTTVAVSVSVPYSSFPLPQPLCRIITYDAIGTSPETKLFLSTEFSCLDAVLDATHVYFTIVSVQANDDSHQQQPYGMNGVGIGRVSLADGSFESIAHGMTGQSVGPRRIYLDGGDIFAVDPFAIAKIPKGALDGKHDF